MNDTGSDAMNARDNSANGRRWRDEYFKGNRCKEEAKKYKILSNIHGVTQA
jgi:hypothetical protein